MTRRQAVLFQKGLIAFDVIVSALAFLVTFVLRQAIAQGMSDPGGVALSIGPFDLEFRLVQDATAYQALFLALIPTWAVVLYLCNTHDFRQSYSRIAVRYARAVSISVALIVTASFLLRFQHVARSFVVMFAALNLAFLVLGRCAVMETAALWRRKHVDGHRVVIVGCGARAVRFAHTLRTQPPWNIKLLGHVCVKSEVCHEGAEPRLCELQHFAELLDGQPVDEVFFAVPDLEPEILAGALNDCDIRGVDILLPLPPALPSLSKVEVATFDGFDGPLLGLRRTPTGEARLIVKRAIDALGSLMLIAVALPIMAVVALAVKLTSSGPVFFKQVRAGRHGRRFTMYKFRSMVADAEKRREDLSHLNEMSGPVFKIKRDPRITSIGNFLRRTSLDELPQLFNIFLGDMSLVGPRPPLPSEVEQYKPWQRRRLSVKPGLTGLWQVSGRNNVDFEEWMRLDLRYIDNWSLWLDLKILLRTVPAVLFKTGAS